ncbi:hypothetical protein AAG906_036962 [Vitis piasezkii]
MYRYIGMGDQFLFHALTQGAETYLLRQQSIGGRRNQVFKNGANNLSPSKRCPEAPPLFPSPPDDHLTGRMLQWAIELSEFGIEFQPRLSMKGQVMADFVLEYSEGLANTKNQVNKNGSRVGLLLQSPTGEHLEQAIRLGFPASNNEAEYEAILSGLDLALALSVSKLRIYSDSQLVVRHVQKEYEAKDARMARYLTKNTSGQTLYRRSQTGTQSPGASCPFHLNWGALVQAILHRTLPSLSYTREYAEIIQEDDLWHIEPIRKDIIGRQ